MRPKHRLLSHMVHAATAAGNPRLYGTFEDKGLNSVLKGIGAAAHRLVWEYRVHLAYELWERAAAARRLRAWPTQGGGVKRRGGRGGVCSWVSVLRVLARDAGCCGWWCW